MGIAVGLLALGVFGFALVIAVLVGDETARMKHQQRERADDEP